jgi:hypothetical protein
MHCDLASGLFDSYVKPHNPMQTSDQINLAIAITSGFSTLMSLAVVVATFKILRANRDTVAVMREQIRSMSRPYVQVTPWVRVGSTLMMLSIRNSGTSSACNLRLSLDKDFYSNGERIDARNLRRYTAFNEVIQSFPPRAELSFHLGVGHVVFGQTGACPTRFTVTAEYEFEGEHVKETTVVDLQPYQYSAQPIDPVAEEIEKLTKKLDQISRARGVA